MTTETEIRRRQDGSIDTAYYMAKGRDARSAEAHKMGRTIGQQLARLLKIRLPMPNAPKTKAHGH